jgi:hypothetical protein
MRLGTLLLASFSLLLLGGCSKGQSATAEDDKFMSDLEAAAAKNGANAPAGKDSRMKAPANPASETPPGAAGSG